MRFITKIRTDAVWVFCVMWAVFFLHGMAFGCWVPALTNVLTAHGMAGWVPAVFLISPACALVTPLVGGAMADQRVAANILFAWLSLACAVLLGLSFLCLRSGLGPWWFLGCFALYSILSAPTWGLLSTIALAGLSHVERQFPLVRVGCTIGWVAGGLVTSLVLTADASPLAGYAGAAARLLLGLVAFLLPWIRPAGAGLASAGRLGTGAFGLLRDPDLRVFFLVTTLVSIPWSALYMYGPEFLKALGDTRPTATMTVAQVSEIVAMLLLAVIMSRYRIKTLLAWGLGLTALRFGMSAHAGSSGLIAWHIGGVALHGLCFALYFITAQVVLDRKVDAGMRGQAQGLFGVVSGGVGPLLGAAVCGWMRMGIVGDNGGGWSSFWWLLSAMSAVSFVLFVVAYGRRRAG